MDRRAWILLTWLVLLAAAPAAFGHHVTFSTLREGSWAQLTAARTGSPFLVMLWSVACEPCQPQLELLAALRRDYPGMPLVLVSTDGLPLTRIAGETLMKAGLEHESNWIISSRESANLLLEIDPDWDGRLPRAYLYDRDHHREAVQGGLDRPQVEAWMRRNELAEGDAPPEPDRPAQPAPLPPDEGAAR